VLVRALVTAPWWLGLDRVAEAATPAQARGLMRARTAQRDDAGWPAAADVTRLALQAVPELAPTTVPVVVAWLERLAADAGALGVVALPQDDAEDDVVTYGRDVHATFTVLGTALVRIHLLPALSSRSLLRSAGPARRGARVSCIDALRRGRGLGATWQTLSSRGWPSCAVPAISAGCGCAPWKSTSARHRRQERTPNSPGI
jgi:hypothetical protein